MSKLKTIAILLALLLFWGTLFGWFGYVVLGIGHSSHVTEYSPVEDCRQRLDHTLTRTERAKQFAQCLRDAIELRERERVTGVVQI